VATTPIRICNNVDLDPDPAALLPALLPESALPKLIRLKARSTALEPRRARL
jgi:hypothetical protein